MPPMLQEIAKDANIKNALAAKVNHRLRELSYILTDDAEIEFLDFKSSDGIKIYETTLRFVIAKAFQNLYPNATIYLITYVSRSILATVDNLHLNEMYCQNWKETRRIVNENYKIERRRIPVESSKTLYKFWHAW